MSVVSGKYWKRYVLGPDHVPRPNPGQSKGYFIIKREFNPEFEYIWVRIGWATQLGHLGHYSGLSNDSKVIAVHVAEPIDPDKIEEIRRYLIIAGATHMKFQIMQGDNEFEVNLADFDFFCGVVFRGRVINKEDYVKNPEFYKLNYAWQT